MFPVGSMKSRKERKKGETSSGAKYAAVVVVVATFGFATLLVLSGRGAAGGRRGVPSALTAGSARGFNVLMITLDTTRADRLGCYGHEGAATPHLDNLARDGVLFADAVTVAPVTLPSHSSIFTGLYPPNHGVRDNGEFKLADEHVTLAEILQGTGYETAAFVSAFVLDARFGLDQGFDVYDDAQELRDSATLAETVIERSASSVTDAAVGWLEGRRGDRPFFAWVHYFDPHQPYQAPEPFASGLAGLPYDAEIAYMDSQIGRLLAALEAQGHSRDSLIVAVADHGESLGEHGEFGHGTFIYEPVMRVPLVLTCRGVFVGRHVVDDVTATVVDVLPTVLELLGVQHERTGDGISLVSATWRRERAVYMEGMTTYLDNGWAPLFGLRTRDHKYIHAPRAEFYRLRSDPGELHNVYANAPPGEVETRDGLASRLGAMLAEWPSAAEAAHTALPADPESLARLEALGYVGGAERERDAMHFDPKDMLAVMDRINEGRGLLLSGRNEEGLAMLRGAAAAAPGSVRLRMMIARVLMSQGSNEEAESVLREALAVKPHAQALVLLGRVMIQKRRFEEADELLRQALKMDPLLGAAHIARGDVAAATGLLREAGDLYRYARQVDPHRARRMADARLELLREHIEKLR